MCVWYTHPPLLGAEVAPCRPPESLVQSQGIRYWYPATWRGHRARRGAPAGGAAQETHTSQTAAGREHENTNTPAAAHRPTRTDTLPRSKESESKEMSIKSVNARMKILTSFTHLHVFPNLYEILSSAEHKRTYFEEFFNCFCPYNDFGVHTPLIFIVWELSKNLK